MSLKLEISVILRFKSKGATDWGASWTEFQLTGSLLKSMGFAAVFKSDLSRCTFMIQQPNHSARRTQVTLSLDGPMFEQV